MTDQEDDDFEDDVFEKYMPEAPHFHMEMDDSDTLKGSDKMKNDRKGNAPLQGRRDKQSNAEGMPSSSSSSSTPFYMPSTIATPVTSHFDAVLECIDLLRSMQTDQNVDKHDVIDSLNSMLHNMLSTIMMHNFSTSMSVSGWVVE